MSNSTILFASIFLIILLALCFFFSGSETSMMSLNRYRVQHLAKQGNSRAKRALKLLQQPDRLLGMIVTGNTCVTITASSLLTFIASHYWGDLGIIIATVCLTFFILLFCEALPKSLAALNPERFALPAGLLLQFFIILCAPLVWIIHQVVHWVLKFFNNPISPHQDHLTPDELYTLIKESGSRIPESYQNMLLQILDLERLTVADIMIPRADLVGIDLDDPDDQIIEQLINSPYRYLPVYTKEFNEVLGFIKIREVLSILRENKTLNREELQKYLLPPYMVPENTSLHQQLINFRRSKKRSALIVDEYGDILGMITMEDLLEEIVGEFTTDFLEIRPDIIPDANGSYLINGQASLREVNRFFNWHLPLNDQKTLAGYLTAYLQTIPEAGTCLLLNKYPLEILQVAENRIKMVKLFPAIE